MTTGGSMSTGGTSMTGGAGNTGGNSASGGISSIGGTSSFGGAGGTSSTNPYCGSAPLTDLGTLSGTTSPHIDLPDTGARCYRFTVASTTAVLHGIQTSNCDNRQVTIDGTLVCAQGSCSTGISIPRSADGSWYVQFTPGTVTFCSTSWWWF